MTFEPSAAFDSKVSEDSDRKQVFDPSAAFDSKIDDLSQNGMEPVLGGKLSEKAVWVDESKCIGCTYCGSVASNTFIMDSELGRARAIRQDGDRPEIIDEAIDTCPVNCIHWVDFQDLDDLRAKLNAKDFRPPGLPPWI